MTFLSASHLSLGFPLYHSESRSLKKSLLGQATSRFGRDSKKRPMVQALQDISFTLASGERLGLIGSNGSGKTTLLRVLSGIYQPSAGVLKTEGSITSLLDPGQGMNRELTGRENIKLRGYFLGLPRAEIRDLEEDVSSFSELGHFMDIPVRNYSSGMVVRLAFAMATAYPPHILLMDEWLLAGDASFMDKARYRVEEMVKHADILVLASHSPSILAQWCGRLLWLEEGRIIQDGKPMEVFRSYLPAHTFRELEAQMASTGS